MKNGLSEVTSLKDLYHIIAELSEIKPLHLLSQGLFYAIQGKVRRREWEKEDSAFNEKWIHIAEYDGKIMSAVVSRRGIKYNNYFGARKGYFGLAATLPEFGSKGLDSQKVRLQNYASLEVFGEVFK